MSILCAMVGATFGVAAAAEVIRAKKGITAVGNAQIDTAQSKFGGSSALFDGTGDYLKLGPETTDFGTGDFTIEGWVRFNSTSGSQVFYDRRENVGINYGILLYWNGSAFVYHGNVATRISGGTAVINTWYHWAVSRNSGSTKMFIDGVQVGSTYTDTLNYTYSSSQSNQIGGSISLDSTWFNGHIDEIRVSNSARYTANFTPSTTPFVNDANTLLLLHMDGTDASTYFEDDNGQRAKKGCVAVGNAQMQTAQQKFGATSAYFDGTGDYLSISPTTDLAFGTGDFTVEFWMRLNSITGDRIIYDGRVAGVYSSSVPVIYMQNAVLKYYMAADRISSGNLSTGVWYHVAVSRSGNSTKMFIDGTQVGSTFTDSTSLIADTTVTFGIHKAFGAGTYDFNGWLDEIRVSNTARYTANFTPSTTPFVNDANTLLLMHMEGSNLSTAFVDDNGSYTAGRTGKHISYYGNAQIDTAQSKFGGSSALFDGTGDYLDSNTTIITLGTSDFTIEGWVRASTTMANNGIFHLSPTGFSTSGNAVDRGLAFAFYNTSTYGWVQYAGNADWGAGLGTAHSANTWYHFAMVRSGSTLTTYINGTSQLSVTDSTNYTAHRLIVGGYYSSSFLMNGWIDEFRISNTARYTANFTPSTTPFQNDANTLLLMHMEGTDAATTFVDDIGGRTPYVGRLIGNAVIKTDQSKFGGASAYFDGTDDYLTVNGDFSQTGNCTFEFWFRPNRVTGTQILMAIGNESSERGALYLSGTQIAYDTYSGGTPDISPTSSFSTGTWYHIAFVRSGSTITIYKDGTSIATATKTGTLGNANNLQIGAIINDANDYQGWIDEFRVSNIARYTANFTAPTSPFQNDANTLLLLHMDGTDNATFVLDDNGVTPTHTYS